MTGIIDSAKLAVEMARPYSNLELNQKLIDLMGQAVDLKEEVIELKDALRQKEAEIVELRRQASFAESTIFDQGANAYVMKDGSSDIRWCSSCWDHKKISVHLHRWDEGVYSCPVCVKGP